MRHLLCPSCDLPPPRSVQDLVHESSLIFGQLLKDAASRLRLRLGSLLKRGQRIVGLVHNKVGMQMKKWFKRYLELRQKKILAEYADSSEGVPRAKRGVNA
ncbi:hypothetical protein EON64_15190 [archaeon]|nr:MAG: hypothetical protein EON64_15190 [archaeon]